MIDNQETQGMIAAEVRNLSKCVRHKMELGDYISVPMPTVYGKPLDVYYAELADRIDAAHKREVEKLNSVIQATVSRSDAEIEHLRREVAELRKQIGNAVKLREAAKYVQSTMERLRDPTDKNNAEFIRIWEIVSAALAAPPRNCDMYQSDEEAFNAWKAERGFRNIGLGQGGYGMAWAFVRWLFFTIKKGGIR